MNAKREEITRFLNNDLLPQVKGELETRGTGDRAQFEQEYREALEQAKRFGVEGQERRFILSERDQLVEEPGELLIRFEYRTDADKRKQADLNAEAVRRILSDERFGDWSEALRAKAPTEKNPNRTLLEKHLT